jgi:hypothetical protein
VQLKGRSISEIKAGLKVLASAGEEAYNINRSLMNPEYAASSYNLALSVPDLHELNGWNSEWDAHVLPCTSDVLETVKDAMVKSVRQGEGIQALLKLVKTEKK